VVTYNAAACGVSTVSLGRPLEACANVNVDLDLDLDLVVDADVVAVVFLDEPTV